MLQEIEAFIDWVRLRNPAAKTWKDYRCDLQLFLGIAGHQNIPNGTGTPSYVLNR